MFGSQAESVVSSVATEGTSKAGGGFSPDTSLCSRSALTPSTLVHPPPGSYVGSLGAPPYRIFSGRKPQLPPKPTCLIPKPVKPMNKENVVPSKVSLNFGKFLYFVFYVKSDLASYVFGAEKAPPDESQPSMVPTRKVCSLRKVSFASLILTYQARACFQLETPKKSSPTEPSKFYKVCTYKMKVYFVLI